MPALRRTRTSTGSGSLSGTTTAEITPLLGIMIWSSPRASVVYISPSELTIPSWMPPSAPACSRTRSPTRNGRAVSSTSPANRLPSVCWAASPSTTAVNALPAISDAVFTPATLSAISTVIASVNRRMMNPTVPAVPGSIRLNIVGPAARPIVPRERPADH